MQADIIAEQISQLQHKQQIQSINIIKRNQYHIVYNPKFTNSPYSQLTYNLKLVIPEKFPQYPPKLIFLDKIYHLNIETTTGTVSMPILFDDWSPYLTLQAVFDSLDNLLEEPDLNYGASASLKEQYVNQPEKYIEKVQQLIRLTRQVRQEMGQSVIEHVQVINDSKVQEGSGPNQQAPEFSNYLLPPNFSNSEAFSESPKLKLFNQMSPISQKQQKIYIQGQNNISPKELDKIQSVQKPVLLRSNKTEQLVKSNGFKMVKESTKKVTEERGNQNMKQMNRQTSNFRLTNLQALRSETQFQKMQLNLKQADLLLNILIEQSNSMEQCLKRNQNSRVNALLERKQQRIIQMLEETLELSSQLREKLFLTLKTSANGLLK